MQNFSKEELISQIKDLQEQLQKIKKQKKYGIVWEEKAENIDKNKLPMLEEDKELRIENDKNKPQNLIIEWDNFHALSVLQNTHKGKVDVIYIDPHIILETKILFTMMIMWIKKTLTDTVNGYLLCKKGLFLQKIFWKMIEWFLSV